MCRNTRIYAVCCREMSPPPSKRPCFEQFPHLRDWPEELLNFLEDLGESDGRVFASPVRQPPPSVPPTASAVPPPVVPSPFGSPRTPPLPCPSPMPPMLSPLPPSPPPPPTWRLVPVTLPPSNPGLSAAQILLVRHGRRTLPGGAAWSDHLVADFAGVFPNPRDWPLDLVDAVRGRFAASGRNRRVVMTNSAGTRVRVALPGRPPAPP